MSESFEYRFERLAALWLETYEEIGKTLRRLPEPISLPPLAHNDDTIDRLIEAAATAAEILYDRAETSDDPAPYQMLANALLLWLAAHDVFGVLLAETTSWRIEALLLTLRHATGQAVIAAQWLRQGPPMPPHSMN